MELALGRLDLFHSPDFVLPPLLTKTSVVTIHDLSFVTHAETAHPAQKRFLDSAVPRAVERATRVIAVSEATRRDVIAIYGAPADKVQVVYNGLDRIFLRAPPASLLDEAKRRFNLPPRFALSGGTLQPRKNLPNAVAAVALARRQGHDIQLVHFGAKGWLSEGVYAAVEKLDDGFVHLLGAVDDRWLPALYALAELTLAVSKAEGFMLPIIESMALGTPVITANVSSMPEVAGDAALLASPDNVDEIAAAIGSLLTDPALAGKLVVAGRSRAARFTWEDAAEQTEAVYRSALGLRGFNSSIKP